MSMIRVGIADDHPVVLQGVSSLLRTQADIDIRFATGRIGELLELLLDDPVDVLVCDYEFEMDRHADGLNLLNRIRRTVPHTRVLFLSSHSSAYIVSAALDAGAAGFIGKRHEEFANLAAAIRSVNNRNVYVPDSLRSRMMSASANGSNRAGWLNRLSEKEATVVRMICEGLSISDIAGRLNRSPKTVSNQKNAGMKKLGARNDVELAKVMREAES
ncbi:response regulator transcription factor [Paraburkholderia caballeronis]|uniref:Two component transcriptional regulator, LuxR family n=1 Tax=Paraburkholderia caballeronis TaxID=416943 RepID=A0A1H7FRV0_9BURK|nr:response regulator transcription factor [Paraburkholderia caballeronis]PXW24928.1 LuxR family two component transcriptional regulator [Paraburkholderia caballeronis]PXX00658.1 LuxR family two component transcriptional regulator [Paraburkholderia caballeronis]RAJ98721.1 LuxR family two component transcriptional regulator [Paraburkholderia caballeronis]TDV16462.1 LuxR family two component transcriptional regulator [Paraburkholderia caballeronis]TDV18858.1 LuxR family two component transcripti